MRLFNMGVEADKDGGETDERVKCGNELRHLRHLHAVRDEVTENGSASQHHQHDEPVADIRSKDSRNDGESHTVMPYHTARLALS